jgi:protease-4
VADAAQRARLGKRSNYQVRYLDGATTPFERFFARFAESRAGAAMLRGSGLGEAMLARALPRAARDLRFLQDALQAKGGAPVKALAYCFCGP